MRYVLSTAIYAFVLHKSDHLFIPGNIAKPVKAQSMERMHYE